MEELRSVLVHIDGGSHAAARLTLARALAARFEARLSALFAVAPHFVPVPVPVPGLGLPAAPLLDEIDPAARRRARACFDRLAGASGWPLQWEEVVNGDPVAAFARHGLHADLMVLGRHDPQDAAARDVPRDFAESVLLASGTPAIVTPRGDAGFGEAACILVAWRPTREAANALKGALPLLQRAQEVHLVNWSEDAATQGECLDAVSEFLRLHAVEGIARHEGPAPANTGEALLVLAEGLGADLLVMGCYGHTRARELVLGGASRTVLHEAPLPVLMAH
ncbi:universal stress protein [Azohydromonas caseinilytica]|uniref:Universal stress protein n=1 Tax=Azohydromonas caseinilytica TaxID=2728836 RepID=A0A848FED7_9BURK|nr:universal stress protein [Azohydromonas caseinilytica]NML17662.1 universal stress protein [Azohydromonas caseinilytica]